MTEANPGPGPSLSLDKPDEPSCVLHPGRLSSDTCGHCGNFGCEDCLGYLGDRLVCQTCVETGRVVGFENPPWERRDELGWASAAWQTIKGVCFSPQTLFSNMDPHGSVGEALLFALLVNFVAGLGMALVAMVIAGAIAAVLFATGEVDAEVVGIVGLVGAFYAGILAVLTPVSQLMSVLIFGLVNHGLLYLFGGGRKGLNATLRTLLYCEGVRIWNLTLIGIYLTGLWHIVVSVLGLPKVHDEAPGPTIAAVLVPMALCCSLYAAYIALIIALEGF